MNNFNFKNLVVLDVANNHQGSLEHGKLIINSFAKVTKNHRLNFGIKFQFRNLDTFIHHDHSHKSDIKHITRFQSTKLAIDDYEILQKLIRYDSNTSAL